MNYNAAKKDLDSYKERLRAKYGTDFKGSQLADDEIDELFRLKERLAANTLSDKKFKKQYITIEK